MSEIKFEIVEDMEGVSPRRGPQSKYEEVIQAVSEVPDGKWVKIPTESQDEAETIRTTLSGLLRRRGVSHRTAIRKSASDDMYAIWITRAPAKGSKW